MIKCGHDQRTSVGMEEQAMAGREQRAAEGLARMLSSSVSLNCVNLSYAYVCVK